VRLKMGSFFFPALFLFLLLCALGCSVIPNGSGTDFHALIIGIDDYINSGVSDLHWCEADATSLHAALLGGGWSGTEITTLLGSAATKNNILSDLGSMLSAADENDFVLLYFSGHGTAVTDLDGDEEDFYDEAIVPVDAVPGNTATLITDDELGALFRVCRTQKGAVVIDSCYSGGVINKSFLPALCTPRFIEFPGVRGAGVSGDLDVLTFPVMTAASQNELSYEDDSLGSLGLRHGVFTYFLLEGLSGRRADRNGDGFITVREMFQYAETHTVSYSEMMFLYSQHPVMRFPMDFIDILVTRKRN
jgi:hypothetical protein